MVTKSLLNQHVDVLGTYGVLGHTVFIHIYIHKSEATLCRSEEGERRVERRGKEKEGRERQRERYHTSILAHY